MLNSKLLFIGVTLSLGLATAAQATVINLDGTGGAANFNGTWSGADYATGGITGGTTVSNQLSMTNLKGIVQDLSSVGLSFTANSDSSTIYFGGTLDVTGLVGGTPVWQSAGGEIAAGFSGPSNTWNVLTTVPSANYNIWGATTGTAWTVAVQDHFGGAYTNSAQGVASGSFEFVLGVTGGSNYTQTFRLWLGANANASTAGTPDMTWSRGGAWDGPYYNTGDLASVGIGASLSGGTTLTSSNMFVSDTWHPVVEIVPEPSAYAMAFAGVAFTAGQLWRRRKRA